MKHRFETNALCSLAALLVGMPAVCAQQALADTKSWLGGAAPKPLTPDLARYQARLYELSDPGEKKYDATFANQLHTLVSPQLARESKFLARLTSGPAAPGTHFVAGERSYVYYGICQAHQCDTTTMDVLFDPASKRMVGKLLDACIPQWLGRPDSAEMTLLDQRHLASYPATATACAGKK
jgi:hypothetical protein